MRCAIIGSTKIAEIHAENLIRKNISEITIISRSSIKRKKLISSLKKKKLDKIIYSELSPKEINNHYFDIICICSKTEVHDYHLKLIKEKKSIIIIEKPIVSVLKLKNKYEIFLKKIFKRNKKIIVCYPYLYLGQSFKKFFPLKRDAKIIKFEFQSKGKSKFKDICVNFMPHALSFFYNFYSNNFLKKIKNKEDLIIKKNQWKVSFKVGERYFIFKFITNPLIKTCLKVSQDNLYMFRKTKIIKNKFINYLYNLQTKKKIIIKNPMISFYDDFFKNINNLNFYKRNKSLTLEMMKKNRFFLY